MAVSAAVADYLAAWDQHAGARQRAEGVVHMVRQAAEALGDWQGAAEIIATRTASFWPAGSGCRQCLLGLVSKFRSNVLSTNSS